MKRIVILIDGTWNDEGQGNDTNIAKLDPSYKALGDSLIKSLASDGTKQAVFYHKGVGVDSDFMRHVLGGVIGVGLRALVRDAYRTLSENYVRGDEIYILGFSRGAYVARALAGLIGTSGIQVTMPPKFDTLFDTIWDNSRIAPAVRDGVQVPSKGEERTMAIFQAVAEIATVDPAPRIKCVAVFDTVGSYGVPAGIGLAALGRYFTMALLGFHDTEIGSHIDIGLHAIAIDEKRRPFMPTLWTALKGRPPKARVEQVWFAGTHCDIGGGNTDPGLAHNALIWMIARLQALTGLEFDIERVKAVTKPNIDGAVFDSSQGWPIDQMLPHSRVVLSPDAIDLGFVDNTVDPKRVHVNEKVHWSVVAKYGNICNIGGVALHYTPGNIPFPVPPDKVAAKTPEEIILLTRG